MNIILALSLMLIAVCILQLFLFFYIRTGVVHRAISGFAPGKTISRVGAYARYSELPDDLSPTAISRLEKYSDCYLIKIEGYEDIQIKPGKETEALVAFNNVTDSAQKIALYSMELVRLCIDEHKRSQNESCLEFAIIMLEDWRRSVARKSLDPFCWYDHAVAARLVSFTVAIDYLSTLSDGYRNLCQSMEKDVVACKVFLSSKMQYDWKTNHGLIIDYNLALANFLKYGNLEPDNQIDKLVCRRALERIDFFVSDDGVVLEPAMSYWFMIREHLLKIVGLLQMRGSNVPGYALEKLQALDNWLSFSTVDGKFARIGDSSGGNAWPWNVEYCYENDGAYVFSTDAGHSYLNIVEDGKAISQLFFNASYMPPLVHAHQDALAVNLIKDNVVWINSPGFFQMPEAGAGKNSRRVECQSAPSLLNEPYRPGCELVNYFNDKDGCGFIGRVDYDKKGNLTRDISFQSESGRLTITDSNENGCAVVSRFLIDRDVVASLDGNQCNLISGEKRLEICISSGKVSLQDAEISFKRNRREKTKMLVIEGVSNQVSFQLTNNAVNTFTKIAHPYPYKKRTSLYSTADERFKHYFYAFHFARIRKLLVPQMLLSALLLIGYFLSS